MELELNLLSGRRIKLRVESLKSYSVSILSSKYPHNLSSAIVLIFISIAQDKKNHKGAETWMLTQRIGTLKLSEIMMEDKEPRIFFDKLVEMEDGRSYKGQW